MVRLLAILALGIGAVLPASTPDPDVETTIAVELPASGAPGVAYAVVTDGEVSAGGAEGERLAGSGEALTAQTPFVIGSISKSFTALAIMQLVEAGEIDLDAPFSDYLTDFADGPAAGITVRQLLSHTSGYSTLQGNASHDGSDDTEALAQVVDGLVDLDPAYAPDERWEYSNTNYQIAGRMLEVVSGQEYQSYIAEHILEPVGMADSFVADGAAHDEMAIGHRPWFFGSLPADTHTDRATAPQGGVVSTADDLALYLQTMMNGEDDVLSAEGKALMMRPASPASPWYGLGWFIDTANGTVWHSGATPGIETLATMVPSQADAVVVFVNRGSGMGFGETVQLRNAVTAAGLDREYAGEGSRWGQQLLFIGLALLPLFYLAAIVWAWLHRRQIRAKSGVAGQFSLWFPLLTTIIAAWVMLSLVPDMIGAPIGTILLFQPDLGLVLIAGAVLGVVWSTFRLVVAFTGRRTSTPTEG
ncbi:hypothetical protein GCM10022200_26890 [Microbacterium awajiense]|uniref:Beta-lactamase-related domain-containing protein n=1 Tax=Microbacterium awajiense TaxID=415214 RepID=A0ABP7AWE2_9MICO